MNSPKQQLMEAVIEDARLKGNWDAVRDHATKFQRKYAPAPSATVYTSLLLGEASMNAVNGWRPAKEIPYDKCPNLVYTPFGSISSGLLIEAMKHLERAVSAAPQASHDSAALHDPLQLWASQARVLLARIDLAIGKPADALQRLSLAQFPDPMPSSFGMYASTMLVMKWVITGWAYMALKNDDAARDAFVRGGEFVGSHLGFVDTAANADPASENGPTSLLNISRIDNAKRSLRQYIQLVSGTPANFVPTKKIAVLRQHLHYLCAMLPGSNPYAGIPTFNSLHVKQSRLKEQIYTLCIEIRSCLPQYERLLTTLSPFPRGEDSTPLSIERSERVLEVYDMWVRVEIMFARHCDELPADMIDRKYRLIEALYRGTKHTFHSLRLLRYLSHAFLGVLLINGDNSGLDERTEAECTVSTYLFYWEKMSAMVLDAQKKRIEDSSPHPNGKPQAVSFSFDQGFETSKSQSVTSREQPVQLLKNDLEATNIVDPPERPDSLVASDDARSSLMIEPQPRTSLTRKIAASALDPSTQILPQKPMLTVVEGENLEQASQFGEKAYLLATQFLSHLPNYNAILKEIYQWLAVVSGEQALEVVNAKDRRRLQSEATSMLQQAVSLVPDDFQAYYQLALQLAEVGELVDAIEAINKSIELKANYPNSYNLLALILSAKSQLDKAIQVAQEGWRVCIIKFSKEQIVKITTSGDKNIESLITWDAVPIHLREDLIKCFYLVHPHASLKFTLVALENERFGPRASLETLLSLFGLLRRVIGVPAGYEERKRSDAANSLSTANNTDYRRRSFDTSLNAEKYMLPSNSSGSVTGMMRRTSINPPSLPIHKSPSASNVSSPQSHRFRMYDMLISMWLTTSAVYRELEDFDGAQQAIAEAEMLAETLAKIELRIDTTPSRILRDSSTTLSGSQTNLFSVQPSVTGRTRSMKPKPRQASSSEVRSIPFKWGFANRSVRRILADIAFENRPAVQSKYADYLSPVAKVEAERQSQLRKYDPIPNIMSSTSLASSITNSTSNPGTTATGIKDPSSGSTNEDGLTNLELTIQNGLNKDLESVDEISSHLSSHANNSHRQQSIFGGALSATQNGTNGGDHPTLLRQPPVSRLLSQSISVDDLISSTLWATTLDPDHLPARVHAGILYLSKGDLAQAEYWLSRACTQTKYRGASSRRAGLTTIYGGATAVWGYLSWHKLAQVMKAGDRIQEAKQSIYFAADLEKVHCIRGSDNPPHRVPSAAALAFGGNNLRNSIAFLPDPLISSSAVLRTPVPQSISVNSDAIIVEHISDHYDSDAHLGGKSASVALMPSAFVASDGASRRVSIAVPTTLVEEDPRLQQSQANMAQFVKVDGNQDGLDANVPGISVTAENDGNGLSLTHNEHNVGDIEYDSLSHHENYDQADAPLTTDRDGDGSNVAKSDDVEDSDSDIEAESRPTSQKDGCLIVPWKVACHKIERIAVRHFGAPRVKEARHHHLIKETVSKDRDGSMIDQQSVPSSTFQGGVVGSTPGAPTGRHKRGAIVSTNVSVVGGGAAGQKMLLPPIDARMDQRASLLPASVQNIVIHEPLPVTQQLREIDTTTNNGGGDSEDDAMNNHATGSLNISIPHGCQIARTLLHQRPGLQSVVYMPSAHKCYWTQSMAVHIEMADIDRIYFASGTQGAMVTFGQLRHVIDDLQIDEWITFTTYDRSRDVLYAVYDANVNIYNYKTGQRIETMRTIHENSISAVMLCQLLSYFVTGSKDSIIKVWNQQNYLLYEFKEHYSTITGLCGVKGYASGESPFMISSSQDGTLRMWNLETGRAVYRMHTQAECLGLDWMKDDHFYTFSSDCITVWYLNRFYSTYTLINSPVIGLSRSESINGVARIFSISQDGSTNLISARTGERLTSAFPVIADTVIVSAVYDIEQETIYVLSANGDVTVFSSISNPCNIVEEWKYAQGSVEQEKMQCFCGVPVKRSEIELPPYRGRPISIFLLFGGSNNGQIVFRDVRRKGKQELLVQAHTAEIKSIVVNSAGDRVFTTANDMMVKIWNIEYLEMPVGNSKLLEQTYLHISKGPANIILTLFASISTSPIDGVPMRCTYSSKFRVMAVAMENCALRLFPIGINRTVSQLKHHPRDEDHTKPITSIALLESSTFCLFATSSHDGTVKIWDSASNSLIREMQFGDSTWSVTFANPRGDLLVGLSDQIALVQVQDYLPAKYLLRLIECDWTDDVVESVTMFDANLDFWKLYRQQIMAANNGHEPELWHLANRLLQQNERPQTSQLDKLEGKLHGSDQGSDTSPKRTDFVLLNELMNPLLPQETRRQSYFTTLPSIQNANPKAHERKHRVYDEDETDGTVYLVPVMSFSKLIDEDQATFTKHRAKKVETKPAMEMEKPFHDAVANALQEAEKRIQQERIKKVEEQDAGRKLKASKPRSIKKARKPRAPVKIRKREKPVSDDELDRTTDNGDVAVAEPSADQVAITADGTETSDVPARQSSSDMTASQLLRQQDQNKSQYQERDSNQRVAGDASQSALDDNKPVETTVVRVDAVTHAQAQIDKKKQLELLATLEAQRKKKYAVPTPAPEPKSKALVEEFKPQFKP
eukprot:jgi/Hompol1/6455/HPOL_002272-RA